VGSFRLFFWVWEVQQRQAQDEFRQRAMAGATAIQRSVQEHLEVLYGLGSLYAAASRPVTRETFREFTKGPLQRYASVQALGWVPRVSAAKREVYLAAARQDGLVDFQIREWTPRRQMVQAPRRDVYYPIFYLEPLEGHTATLGLNLGWDPVYMDAMQKALNTEEAMASAWLSLAPDTAEQFSVLLFLPIYHSGVPHRTLEERRANLQGFVMALFRLGPLVEKSLQGVALETIGLQLSDVTDAVSSYGLSLQLRTSHVSSWTFLPRQSTAAEAMRAGLHWETTFNVAGRTWSVLFHPIAEARLIHTWLPWSILVGGMLLTLLCAGFIQGRGGR
jgi:CHASE1-domain containing sensor protein